MPSKPIRLAFVVSHPVQYYTPFYRRLATRHDVRIRIFFTWHAGEAPAHDPGFQQAFAWDIRLTDGYDYELVPNLARDPGTHHFWGLRNPSLIDRLLSWKPDAVHLTGYAFYSHLMAIRRLSQRDVPVLFRGDSHLLDKQQKGLRWELKRFVLRKIYRSITGFLYVGKNNYDYYRTFGVPESRLFRCPHSIDVNRFAESNDQLEAEARRWRKEMRISESAKVLLYAGKFEPKKQPLQLMKAVSSMTISDLVLVLVGSGQLEKQVRHIAAEHPDMFRVLPFQNQSLMPVVYRLGDVFTLPSAYDETWGLAANEALASGRRVLVSSKVGCAPDVVESKADGYIFISGDWADFQTKLRDLFQKPADPAALRARAARFNIDVTERALYHALEVILPRRRV